MRYFVAIAFGSWLAACSGDDGHGEEPVDCAKETRADEFVIGLHKVGDNGHYDFTITSFTPAPPGRFLNEWTISIMSTASPAAPLAATDAVAMTPYMLKHGHGAGIDVVIEPTSTAGEFKFSDINLHMPGVWDVTVEVGSGAENYDKVVFIPCLPE